MQSARSGGGGALPAVFELLFAMNNPGFLSTVAAGLTSMVPRIRRALDFPPAGGQIVPLT